MLWIVFLCVSLVMTGFCLVVTEVIPMSYVVVPLCVCSVSLTLWLFWDRVAKLSR